MMNVVLVQVSEHTFLKLTEPNIFLLVKCLNLIKRMEKFENYSNEVRLKNPL